MLSLTSSLKDMSSPMSRFFAIVESAFSPSDAVNMVTISVRPGCRPQPPDPEGTSPVGIQIRSIEKVTRIIALI
jgi:hypothetical protein